MSPSPKISVLIPTIGRVAEPLAVLRALLDQTHPPFEVIVVDQNSPPLPELVEFCAQHPPVRRIFSELTGVTANENLAIREARGEVIVFLDDDVEFGRDLLAAHAANYADPGVGGVAGRVLQPVGDVDPERVRRVGTYSRLTGRTFGGFNSLKRQDVVIAQGCNMSFRRQWIDRAGPIDERFSGNGYYWESEFSFRMHRLGCRIVFDPKSVLDHLMAPRGGCRVTSKAEHTYYFLRNGLRFFRLHGWLWALPLRVVTDVTYAALKALKNRDLAVARAGLRGVRDGLTQPLL